jgi:hypothetical protein
VAPSVIVSVEDHPKEPWSAANWLALTMGLCGVGTIVALIFVAVHLMRF